MKRDEEDPHHEHHVTGVQNQLEETYTHNHMQVRTMEVTLTEVSLKRFTYSCMNEAIHENLVVWPAISGDSAFWT